MALAGPLYSNPRMAKAKLDAALAKIKTHSQVDTSKIAAIGYCFGGSMVLGYANTGADLDGVVSFHGGLEGLKADKNTMKSQVLVCHGIDDSFVKDQDSAAYRKQLEDAGIRYEFKSYPNAKHAFTNPEATENGKKHKIDVAYNEEADKNSWNDMKSFLERVFK
jgi:dienelactone hydrolase